MSSAWKNENNSPCNPFKPNFNSHWGKGDFSCIHTLNDKDGPWWKAKFEKS